MVKKTMTIGLPERHRQTDGRTDRIAISISRVIVLTTVIHKKEFGKSVNIWRVMHKNRAAVHIPLQSSIMPWNILKLIITS